MSQVNRGIRFPRYSCPFSPSVFLDPTVKPKLSFMKGMMHL